MARGHRADDHATLVLPTWSWLGCAKPLMVLLAGENAISRILDFTTDVLASLAFRFQRQVENVDGFKRSLDF